MGIEPRPLIFFLKKNPNLFYKKKINKYPSVSTVQTNQTPHRKRSSSSLHHTSSRENTFFFFLWKQSIISLQSNPELNYCIKNPIPKLEPYQSYFSLLTMISSNFDDVPRHTFDSDSYYSDFRDDSDTVPFVFTNSYIDYLHCLRVLFQIW
jgi:hypothetical protein